MKHTATNNRFPTVEHWYGKTTIDGGQRCITVSFPKQNRLVVCHHYADTEEERINRAVQAAVKLALGAHLPPAAEEDRA